MNYSLKFKQMEYSELYQDYSDQLQDPSLYPAAEPYDSKPHILSMKNTTIREVWDYNLEEEFFKIMDLIEKYNVIAMDTEFPGVVNPNPKYENKMDIEYQVIKDNVNELKLIQVGISLSNEQGEVPEENITWQFNFRFDLGKDKHLSEAISLLKNSGINFELLKSKGIDHDLFAEFLISSGIVLNEDIKWISFHGGFDFAYLLKLINPDALLQTEKNFYSDLNRYFPRFYDIKYLIKDFDHIKDDGLNKLATDICVDRIGPKHQAGSDSLVTLAAFFKLKETLFKMDPSAIEKHENILFGVGQGFIESNYHWNYKYNPNTFFYDYNIDQSNQYTNYILTMNMMNPNYYNQGNYPQTDSFFRNTNLGSNFNYNSFIGNQAYPFVPNSVQDINNNAGMSLLYKSKSSKLKMEK